MTSESDLLARMRQDNPWWDGAYSAPHATRRLCFAEFSHVALFKEMNQPLVLFGQSQIGKTVMPQQLTCEALAQAVEPKHILMVSLKEPVYQDVSLDALIRLFIKAHKHRRKQNLFVVFDDIHYCLDWEEQINGFIDRHYNVRFVLAGTSGAILSQRRPGAAYGRFKAFFLPPLNFAEYLEHAQTDADRLPNEFNEHYSEAEIVEGYNARFLEYINFDGYPESTFNPEMRENYSAYFNDERAEQILKADLTAAHGITDIEELKQFFKLLVFNNGEELNFGALSHMSGLLEHTIRTYLEYLESAYLIIRVNPVDINMQKLAHVDTFKVYLTNPAMHTVVFQPISADNRMMHAMAENTQFVQGLFGK